MVRRVKARLVPPSDVSVVLLSNGEATTGRALASLERQTLAPAEILRVDGVSPFHRALNLGAARVSTPFFVQLDADMVLDPECLELLRGSVAPDVGIALGALRDPLMGNIAGVKLFRRACFDEFELEDSITQDVDFSYALRDRGWLTRYLIRHTPDHVITFGDHRPDYTPEYTFGTYHQLGARYRHRRDVAGVQWRMGVLRRSDHEMAPVARLALGHGLFCAEERDAPKRPPTAEQLAAARGLLEGADDYRGALACLDELAGRDIRTSWLAEASLCDGLCRGERP
jgi:hypothetical protein